MKEASLDMGEFHPMAPNALRYIKKNLTAWHIEALASSALEGSRTADICLSTYNRIQKGLPISDRYVLGLAWFVKELVDAEESNSDGVEVPKLRTDGR